MLLFLFYFFSTIVLDTDHNRSNSSDYVRDGIDLHLHRSNKLLDDNFVFIKRDENHTQLIDDFDKLAEKYSNCFYRNENSAIDLCDGNVVSDVFISLDFLLFSVYIFYDLNETNHYENASILLFISFDLASEAFYIRIRVIL